MIASIVFVCIACVAFAMAAATGFVVPEGRENRGLSAFGMWLFGVVCIMGTLILTYESACESTRQEAADAGAAEWTVDAKTGVREFRWLSAQEDER